MGRRRYNPDKNGVFCYYCGKGLHLKNATLDHVIPKSKGGVNAYSNLVACCLRCNKLKANLSVEEFRSIFIADYVKVKNPYALEGKFAFEVKEMILYRPKGANDPDYFHVRKNLGVPENEPLVRERADWVY